MCDSPFTSVGFVPSSILKRNQSTDCRWWRRNEPFVKCVQSDKVLIEWEREGVGRAVSSKFRSGKIKNRNGFVGWSSFISFLPSFLPLRYRSFSISVILQARRLTRFLRRSSFSTRTDDSLLSLVKKNSHNLFLFVESAKEIRK